MKVDLRGVAGAAGRRAGAAQRALDAAVLRDCGEFVPRRSGALAASGRVEPGGGAVVYGAAHARRVYFGEGRGARWFERAKAAKGREWVREAQEAARG